jgi:hypothetical protein
MNIQEPQPQSSAGLAGKLPASIEILQCSVADCGSINQAKRLESTPYNAGHGNMEAGIVE